MSAYYKDPEFAVDFGQIEPPPVRYLWLLVLALVALTVGGFLLSR